MRFKSVATVLPMCMLEYYRISYCHGVGGGSQSYLPWHFPPQAGPSHLASAERSSCHTEGGLGTRRCLQPGTCLVNVLRTQDLCSSRVCNTLACASPVLWLFLLNLTVLCGMQHASRKAVHGLTEALPWSTVCFLMPRALEQTAKADHKPANALPICLTRWLMCWPLRCGRCKDSC